MMKVKDTRVFDGNKIIADIVDGNKIVPREGHESQKGEIVAFLNHEASSEKENEAPVSEEAKTEPTAAEAAASEADSIVEEAKKKAAAITEQAEKDAKEAVETAKAEAAHGSAADAAINEAMREVTGEEDEPGLVNTSMPPASPFKDSPVGEHPYGVDPEDLDKVPFGLVLKPGMPKPPKLDPKKGTKTPEFMHWVAKHFPEEFKTRYRKFYLKQEALRLAAARKKKLAKAEQEKMTNLRG